MKALVSLLLVSVVCALVVGDARAKKVGKAREHREAATQCSATRPAGKPDKTGGECKADRDCSVGKNGRCAPHSNGRMAPANACSYDACVADADCGPKSLCTCDGQGNYCSAAACRTDADCGAGNTCAPSYPLCSLNGPSRPAGWFCHKPSDECGNDDDCAPSTHKGYGPEATKCVYSQPLGHFTCESRECPVG